MYDADLTSQHAESTPVKVAGPVNYNASSDSGVVSLGMLIYNLITTHLRVLSLIWTDWSLSF